MLGRNGRQGHDGEPEKDPERVESLKRCPQDMQADPFRPEIARPERIIHGRKNNTAVAVRAKDDLQDQHLRRQRLYQLMLQDHDQGRGNDQRNTD
jgi:hypothetical protein